MNYIKHFLLILFSVSFVFMLSSCEEDKRKNTIRGNYSCTLCHGNGYIEITKYMGLLTIKEDCFLCASRFNDNRETSPSSKSPDTGQSTQSYDSGPEYVEEEVFVPCLDCNGDRRCRYCNGLGIDAYGGSDINPAIVKDCVVCHGSGNCTICYGTGGQYQRQMRKVR